MESALAKAIRMVVESVGAGGDEETELRRLLAEVVHCARIEERNAVLIYGQKATELSKADLLDAIAEGAHP